MSTLTQLRVVIVVALCVPAFSAGAGDRSEDLIRRAMDLRKIGDDQSAYPLLQEAQEISRSPRATAQLGFCEQALGRWPDAETHLTEALRFGEDRWVKKNHVTIEGSLAVVKSHVARVEVVGEPPGVEVLINAVSIGRLPLKAPVRVAAGEIYVELRGSGVTPVSRSLRVEGGQYQQVVLRAAPPAEPTAAATTQPPPVVAKLPATSATPTGTTSQASGPPPNATGDVVPSTASAWDGDGSTKGQSDDWRETGKWVAAGLAAAALGAGIYGVLHNRSLVSEFDSHCAIDPLAGAYALPNSMRSTTACEQLRSSYQSAARLGLGGLVGAALFTGLATVLWMTAPTSGEQSVRTASSPSCIPALGATNEASVLCAFRF